MTLHVRHEFWYFEENNEELTNRAFYGRCGNHRDEWFMLPFKDVRAQKFPRADFFQTLTAGRK